MNNIVKNNCHVTGPQISLHPVPHLFKEREPVFFPEVAKVVGNFPDIFQRVEVLVHSPAIVNLEVHIAVLLRRKAFKGTERKAVIMSIEDRIVGLLFFKNPDQGIEMIIIVHEKRLKILIHEICHIDQAGIYSVLGPVKLSHEQLVGGADKSDRNDHAKPSLNLVILTNAKLSYNKLMLQQWIVFCLIFLGSTEIFAQDERYYRQILTGELPETADLKDSFVRNYLVKGSEYMVDLDGDGIEEIIQPEKRDGIDWLTIMNSSRSVVYSAKFYASGGDSSIYKLRLVNLTPRVKTLIVFLDDGITRGLRFESTARIYFLTWEDNKLSSLTLNPGPHIYHEKEAQREQYWRRDFVVDVTDLNEDSKREIIVHFGHIQHIYEYKGSGEWTKI
jgi:hypothetical protein